MSSVFLFLLKIICISYTFVNEWLFGINELSQWMNLRMNRCVDGMEWWRKNREMNFWLFKLSNGWMNEWLDEPMDG